MKTPMFYEIAPDGMAKVGQHIAAHQALLQDFHARGVLLMAGPYGNPPLGALGFTSQQVAEEFSAVDTFVLNGVVSRFTLHPWNEALA